MQEIVLNNGDEFQGKGSTKKWFTVLGIGVLPLQTPLFGLTLFVADNYISVHNGASLFNCHIFFGSLI